MNQTDRACLSILIGAEYHGRTNESSLLKCHQELTWLTLTGPGPFIIVLRLSQAAGSLHRPEASRLI